MELLVISAAMTGSKVDFIHLGSFRGSMQWNLVHQGVPQRAIDILKEIKKDRDGQIHHSGSGWNLVFAFNRLFRLNSAPCLISIPTAPPE